MSNKASFLKQETIALHSGHQPDTDHHARAVPIYQTTSYVFESIENASSLFNMEQGGHIYSRISNPTVAVLEQRIAALEGGSGAVCAASGMSALFITIISLCSAGDHIVSSAQMYGSTLTLLSHTLKRLGIETTFVEINDSSKLRAAIRPQTRLILCESIGNPSLEIADVPSIARIATEHHIPLLVDATFATPCLNRPLDHGANIVVHSLTKWIGGHGNTVAGVVVDGGNFDWGADDKFSQLVEPYAPFHGIRFWDEYGPNALAMKIRAEAMRDIGACLSAHSAFLILQGVETLNLRMERHVYNARALCSWLGKQEAITWVNHPDMPEHPTHRLAKKLFPNGAGSIICFGVVGGRAGGEAFIRSAGLSSHLANVGDARTLVLHPGSTTHSRLDAEALIQAGIKEDMIRVSVGLEHIDDICADFKVALKAALRTK